MFKHENWKVQDCPEVPNLEPITKKVYLKWARKKHYFPYWACMFGSSPSILSPSISRLSICILVRSSQSHSKEGESKKKKNTKFKWNRVTNRAMNKKRRIFQANPKDPSPIRTTFPTEFRSSESESNAAKGLSSNFSHLEFVFSNLISL